MMPCCIVNCNSRTNKETASCWLCGLHAHLKCAGLSGKVDRSKGVKWTCPTCRPKEESIREFFNHYMNDFNEIASDLAVLNQKFKMYESNIKNFMLQSCPANGINNDQGKEDTLTLTTKPVAVTNMISSISEVNANKPMQTSNVASALEQNVPLLIVDPPSPATSDSVGTVNPISPPHDVRPVGASSTSNAAVLDCTSSIPNNRGSLIFLPPRKSVFLSRCLASTTEDNIKDYILSKCPNMNINEVSIFKFNKAIESDIASFKLVTSNDNFNTLCSADFWPTGALVKEFIKRRRPRVPIISPHSNGTNSKN